MRVKKTTQGAFPLTWAPSCLHVDDYSMGIVRIKCTIEITNEQNEDLVMVGFLQFEPVFMDTIIT